jgi:hypothetical protein
MACDQSIEDILRVISDCLSQYAKSPQILGIASDGIRALLDAMLEIKASSFYNRRSPIDFAEELMHSIDWKECRSSHIRSNVHCD